MYQFEELVKAYFSDAETRRDAAELGPVRHIINMRKTDDGDWSINYTRANGPTQHTSFSTEEVVGWMWVRIASKLDI
jgi:hypothetical protein